MLVAYSSLVLAVLILGSPYWLLRMVTSGRYRAGLSQRLGRVPESLKAAIAGHDVIWLHAVSVGEALAATRLVHDLEQALPGCRVVISTTTVTGQSLARERFGSERVFFYPLDLPWAVRRFLGALQPKMLVLMESELWPAMLDQCRRARIPVAVVNARVSDRSFRRGLRLRPVWSRVLEQVRMFAAQSDEDGQRLIQLGARADSVHIAGNLKYDVRAPKQSRAAELIRNAAGRRPVVVAGSTTADNDQDEESALLHAWNQVLKSVPDAVLVVAPRHPERFGLVYSLMQKYGPVRATELMAGTPAPLQPGSSILLDTIGDLAAVYGVSDVAFIGGSLVQKGGHNPLEPAQFGVPVVMGPSYQNFRNIIRRMREADAIRIVQDGDQLAATLIGWLQSPAESRAIGEHARSVFETESGATARTIEMLAAVLQEKAVSR
ncbi:MAG: 3-deoxy-D-manno-octulosonic acid transferase [Acidobacteriota bacterium]|nr:3-deoxy-D-manno-octulosonic acid transferase [Acidobacteriota bacterium]